MQEQARNALVDVKYIAAVVLFILCLGWLGPSTAQEKPTPPLESPATLDPKAIAILRASCDTLSAARTMTFTALDTFERVANTGQPLYYTVHDQVAMKRPDRLRVIKLGDGTPDEFYYNGTRMTLFVPSANRVSTADAPPTLDQMLDAAWNVAGAYFPFAHVMTSTPCAVLDGDVKSAIYVGQSTIVGRIRTDVIAVASDDVQAQLWIGASDHLPRMVREIYAIAPGRPRYQTEYSDWRLNVRINVNDFASVKANKAQRVPFGPTHASPPPTGAMSSDMQVPVQSVPNDQPLPPHNNNGMPEWRVQKAGIIGD